MLALGHAGNIFGSSNGTQVVGVYQHISQKLYCLVSVLQGKGNSTAPHGSFKLPCPAGGAHGPASCLPQQHLLGHVHIGQLALELGGIGLPQVALGGGAVAAGQDCYLYAAVPQEADISRHAALQSVLEGDEAPAEFAYSHKGNDIALVGKLVCLGIDLCRNVNILLLEELR